MPYQHRHLSTLAPAVESYEQRTILNHEARNALSVILLTTEAFQYEIFGSLTNTQKEALSKLHENTVHLQTLLEDILQILVDDQKDRYK